MPTRQQINPPPLRKITDFKSKLIGGGARSNLFEVVLNFPSMLPQVQKFLIKQDS